MSKPDKDLEDHQLPVDEIVTFVDPSQDPAAFLAKLDEWIDAADDEED